MMCAWNKVLNILPDWLCKEISTYNREEIDEIRLRINSPPELITVPEKIWLERIVTGNDLNYCINAACRYSPWSAAGMSQGFITADGGHRIGICGEMIMKDGMISGIRNVSSLNIRIAKDFSGITDSVIIDGHSFLVLGAPGWGKTTVLRDLARRIAENKTVSVIDERGELFPDGIQKGKNMDILFGCPKRRGIEMLIRTMTPDYIVVDEVTAAEDAAALLHAVGCGVKILASAHASSLLDFNSRPIYKKIIRYSLFDICILMNSSRSFSLETLKA